MSGQIFIHIGPPKTATTSLQVAAERLRDNRYFYAGTLQPRDRNSGSIAQQLHQACLSGDKKGHQAAEKLREECDFGKLVFLSEEMFLVHSGNVSWQQKLTELHSFLVDAPVTILLTLRKPTDALPSLYQELFRGVPLVQKLSFSSFCRNDYANCFDYDFLLSEISSAGFQRVRLIDFTRLTSPSLSTSEVFGLDTDMAVNTLDVGWENKGKTGQVTNQRQLPSVTFKNLADAPGARWLIDHTLRRDSSLRKMLSRSAERLSLRGPHQRNLVVPREVGQRLDQIYLRHVAEGYGTINFLQRS